MFPSLHIGHLLVPTTALAAAAGILAALLLSQRTAPRAGADPAAVWDAGLFAVVAAFVASRLLLVAADPRSFVAAPLLLLALPSLTVTGVLLSALATLLFLRVRRISPRPVLDAWAAPGALLWCALALGDFVAGTDPGTPTTLPWGVASSYGRGLREQPVALYAAAVAAALLGVTLYLARARRIPFSGGLASLALVLGGAAQFALSFWREPLLAAYTPTPLVEPLQWLALVAVALGVVLYVARPLSRPQPDADRVHRRWAEHHAL